MEAKSMGRATRCCSCGAAVDGADRWRSRWTCCVCGARNAYADATHARRWLWLVAGGLFLVSAGVTLLFGRPVFALAIGAMYWVVWVAMPARVVQVPGAGCPRCDYELAGTRSEACPECGFDLPRRVRETRGTTTAPPPEVHINAGGSA